MTSPAQNKGSIESIYPEEVTNFIKENKSEVITFFKELEAQISSAPSEAHNLEELTDTIKTRIHQKFPQTEDPKFEEFIRSRAVWIRAGLFS